MMRSQALKRNRLRAELAGRVRAHRLRRCCRRTRGPAARSRHESRRLVAAPDDDVGGRLDVGDLVAVLHLLVAGEVQHLRAGARETPGRSRTARRCPGRRRPARPFRPARSPSASRSAPSARPARPGCSCVHRSDEPPISSTIVDTRPSLAVDPGAGQRQALPSPAACRRAAPPAFRSSAAGRTAPAGSARAAAGARTTTSTIVGVRRSTRTTVARSDAIEHGEEIGVA